MNIKIKDNETILKEDFANHFKGVESVGGKLWLTNLRLFFKSHSSNFQPHEESYSLSDVVSVEPLSILNLVPIGIAVVLKDGRREKFVVDRQDWLTNISSELAHSQAQENSFSFKEVPNSDVEVFWTEELERECAWAEDIKVSAGATVSITRSIIYEHTIELKQNDALEGKLELEAGFEARVKAAIRGSILKKIEQEKGKSYTGSETVNRRITLDGNTANKYQVICTYVWRRVLVKLPGDKNIIPFRFHESTEINAVQVEPNT